MESKLLSFGPNASYSSGTTLGTNNSTSAPHLRIADNAAYWSNVFDLKIQVRNESQSVGQFLTLHRQQFRKVGTQTTLTVPGLM